MAGLKVKKNDTVEVISGKDRGKRGRVIEVLPKTGRVRVEGVNKVKRHTKPNPQRNVKGGIVEREDPIHVSNVALIDPKSDKPTRVGSQELANGTRIRIARASGMALDK
jgi:large subunit ribosomal protein L24